MPPLAKSNSLSRNTRALWTFSPLVMASICSSNSLLPFSLILIVVSLVLWLPATEPWSFIGCLGSRGFAGQCDGRHIGTRGACGLAARAAQDHIPVRVPLPPKPVSERAAMYHELSEAGHWAVYS